MKHKAKITISRPQRGDGVKEIRIAVRDDAAGIWFLELKIDPSDFAECITGLASMPCEMTFRGLENVGKVVERGTIEFKIPCEMYSKDRKNMAIKAAVGHTPQGWIASDYYGSQDSFFTKDDEPWARTSIHRWVDKHE